MTSPAPLSATNGRSTSKIAEKNPMWKGDDVGYSALHSWVKRRKAIPEACEKCNEVKKLDLANISGKYFRALDDWEWLCRKCHMITDKRLEGLIQQNKDKRIIDFFCIICGEKFKPKRIIARFCSKSCHAVYHNLYVRSY